ncbi:hypothetical protein Pcinc_004093 [Petrolisthes cinctipes]|uniref:Major facilitator superfamily (MFS) profile domain-containing protein n=1 Tax=Petrolisthes cinctipes TaxID=88211 RepID=A0AAE1GHX5_PETCI|nr:hypothetical protein Pcinc_004093 [Petrolisthes cinctipes]
MEVQEETVKKSKGERGIDGGERNGGREGGGEGEREDGIGGGENKGDLATFEDLLETAGTNGRWNILMFIMCSMQAFISPLQSLTYQFLGATPDHWCLVPQLHQANWTQHQVISLAIPHTSNTTEEHDHCDMYNYNYTEVVEMGYEAAMLNKSALAVLYPNPVQCLARDFNYSQYQSTVVTEWDLVCERRVIYSTTQAIVMVGKLLGFICFGYLIDKWGRRKVVLLTAVFNIVSSFLIAASPTVEIYIILKGIMTAMDAGEYLAFFVFVMESCAARYRAGVGAMFVIPWALGYMVAPGIAYLIRTWQLLHAVYALPTLYCIIFFWWLPESPRWLITQGRLQESLHVLTWAAKVNGRTLPTDDVILAAMTNIEKQTVIERTDEVGPEEEGWRLLKELKHFFILVLIPHLRLRTLVVFVGWFSASMVYYGVALNASNLGTDPYLYVFFGGLLEVPSYLLLWLMMVFVGRKRSLALLYFICAVCIFSVMAIMMLQPHDEGLMAVVVLSQAGKVAVTAAFQLIWAYTSELYPTRVRSLAVGQSSVCARVGSLLSPYINDILGNTSVWAPSAVFGIVSLVAAALTLTLPETRNSVLTESTKQTTTHYGTTKPQERKQLPRPSRRTQIQLMPKREETHHRSKAETTSNSAYSHTSPEKEKERYKDLPIHPRIPGK